MVEVEDTERNPYDVPNKDEMETLRRANDCQSNIPKKQKKISRKPKNSNLDIYLLNGRTEAQREADRPYIHLSRDYISVTVMCACRLKIKVRVIGDFEYYCRCTRRVFLRGYIEDASS